MNSRPAILVVDDERQMRRMLRVGLEGNGYRVHEAMNGQEGLEQAVAARPEIIVLDLGLPDVLGLEVLKRLREWSNTPVIVLSVQDTEEDKIALLDAGANDYVTKPFSMGELLARIRVAIRLALPQVDSPIMRNGPLAVDLARRLVTVEGREVRLTAMEFALLRLFIQHVGKVLTHRQLLREIWGAEYVEELHYLHVYMSHLRRKLEPDPAHPTLFLTEPGVGYRLAERKGPELGQPAAEF